MTNTKNNISLDKDDKYFLNSNKTRRQWLCGYENFHGSHRLNGALWYMVTDYLFRLSTDYTMCLHNSQMREDKKIEKLSDLRNNAETVLKLVGIKVNES